jgi:(1->4)-alpha-D-glucan 1-alpha-D-glucosylmutase
MTTEQQTTGDGVAEAQGARPEPRDDEGLRRLLTAAASSQRIPRATYRFQFNSDFTLDDAAELVPYLAALGISHVYASPLFVARAGSTHGYDVCDPTRISRAVGGEEALDRLAGRLAEHGMSLLLDIVPNHMGINDPCNQWWLDVLENGPSSLYAPFFDISWEPSKPELAGRVLLPVLEDQYGAVLEAGKLKLSFSDGGFWVEYYDNRYPVAPGAYGPILEEWVRRLREDTGGEAESARGSAEQVETAALELESVITAVGYLPGRGEQSDERRRERAREKEIIKRRLATVWGSGAAFNALQATLAHFNGTPGDPASFDPLDALLESQAYRLAFWRVAGEEINYRRFFDIRDLAALRVEDPRVFDATHALALRLLAAGKVSGLRIDHPDGLFHPADYFRRLQEGYLLAVAAQRAEGNGADAEAGRGPDGTDAASAGAPTGEVIRAWLDSEITRAAAGEAHAQWPLYVVAEKILSDTEPLPWDWAVDGTTGYDFLASANAVLVDRESENDFTRLYAEFTGEDPDFEALTVRTQRLIMREALASEINELSHSLERVAERNRHTRDFTLNILRDAIRSLVASLPVYRTYIDPASGQVSARDRHYIAEAIDRAQALSPYIDASVFRFLQETLLLENHARFRGEDRPALAHWVMKLQQVTGPVMAKGVEDTAFYRYNRLVSLNEVGGHPSLFGIDPEQFHKDNLRRLNHWPHSMLTTSTHDNKRSEDARARINVLSELPAEWGQALLEWSALNVARKSRRAETGELMPDRNDEYLLYQILLGAWPLAENPQPGSEWGPLLPPGEDARYAAFIERIGQYVNKAIKEAKVHGSWINPDAAYDGAAQEFVAALLAPGPENRFLPAFAPFARRVAFLGQINALSQVALKLTSPGMPDLYQGNELWDFSLVDPDNRRPVDYARRRALLDELATRGEGPAVARELLARSHDGRIKLFVTARLLALRREREALFRDSDYTPLEVRGPAARHAIAFARRAGETVLVVIAPRLPAALLRDETKWPVGAEPWGETEVDLPDGWQGRTFSDALTGAQHVSVDGRLRLRDALAALPVAALVTRVR